MIKNLRELEEEISMLKHKLQLETDSKNLMISRYEKEVEELRRIINQTSVLFESKHKKIIELEAQIKNAK